MTKITKKQKQQNKKKGKLIMTKKRITKRVVALMATAMMLVGMAVPAMAAPASKGSITVHKYAGNKASAIENKTGEELSAADLANKITDEGYVALEGAKFKLYQAVQADLNALKTTMSTTPALKVEGHTIDMSGSTPVIVFDMSTGPDVSIATALYDDGVSTEKTTDAAGTAKFGTNNLPDGYYVLEESFTPADHSGAVPSLIQLPLTDSTGKANHDIHVYPKNVSTANLTKKDMGDVDAPVKSGDILTFDLKLKFKNTATNAADKVDSAQDLEKDGTFGMARITEIFSNDFNYEEDTLKVYWLKADGTVDLARELASTDYNATGYPAATATGGTINIQLTNDGLTAAKTGNEVGFGVVVQAKYVGFPVAGQADAKVVNKMEGLLRPADGTNITPPGPNPPPTEDTVYAPTLRVKVEKTDAATDAALAGVTFAICKVAVPQANYDPAAAITDYTAAELAEYVLGADGKPITATTNALGELYFSNLEGYSDATGAKFYLKEISTVAGYQLKMNTIEVAFANKATYQADTTKAAWFNAGKWTQAANILATAEVENYKLTGPKDPDELGFSLPLTGGAGTVAFTVAGILVMLGAALLIVRKKKVA